MRFSVIFCIYDHIWKYIFDICMKTKTKNRNPSGEPPTGPVGTPLLLPLLRPLYVLVWFYRHIYIYINFKKLVCLLRKHDLFPRKLIICFGKMICRSKCDLFEESWLFASEISFSFRKNDYFEKENICFENMICSLENKTYSKKNWISGAPKGRYLQWRAPVPDTWGALPGKPGQACLGPNISAPGPKAPRAC